MKITYKLREEFARIAEKTLFANPCLFDKEQYWMNLCLNESVGAIQLLEQNQDKICWYNLSGNKFAIEMLRQNMDKIYFTDAMKRLFRDNENVYEIIKEMTLEEIYEKSQLNESETFELLSQNPGAIPFLKQHIAKINWKMLSKNHNAIELLQANIERIDWDNLSRNYSAIDLLEANMEKIDWIELSCNKNARDLLLQNPHRINWDYLSKNENMIDFLKQNLDKINWRVLAKNPNALQIIKEHPEVFFYLFDFTANTNKSREALEIHMQRFPKDDCEIWQYPCIFEIDYDYDEIRKQMQESGLAEEIISTALHPNRVAKWVELGFDDF